MCGIIARVGRGGSVNKLVNGLENLEYRGYDSAGVAVQNGTGLKVHKRSGRVDELVDALGSTGVDGNVGIGHTRWSTHGPPTDANAHPHTNTRGDVAVVHNGVIENYDELREELVAAGARFTSETDTEVVPHLVGHYIDEGHDAETAFRRAIDRIEGSYAVAVLVQDDETVYAARDGSPLVVGMADEEYYLASDVPAFLEFTDRVVYLEDGDVVVASPTSLRVTDQSGAPVDRETETVSWDADETGKGTYEHYMLKEIHTQPQALSKTIEGRVDGDEAALEDFGPGSFDGVREVQFVACGTSYHAALYAQTLLRQSGVRAEAIRANEYGVEAGPVDEQTLAVAVTQSGETADTLSALEAAKDAGARTLTVTNVVGSSATRVAEEELYIRAGPEIGVAATKTFSSQAVTLTMLADRLVGDVADQPGVAGDDGLFESLPDLPAALETVLETSTAQDVARRHMEREAYFFIGRGLANSVAKEAALKFKEITYEHAEGFAAGELKHGPLALVTPQTPLFAVATGDEEQDAKTFKNAKEAQARGAPIVAVAPDDSALVDIADQHLRVPDVHPVWAALLANVQLQLVAYHAAAQLDRPIDKPRNLAKSVTVE